MKKIGKKKDILFLKKNYPMLFIPMINRLIDIDN